MKALPPCRCCWACRYQAVYDLCMWPFWEAVFYGRR